MSASGQVDVRAGKVDFHVHVVGGIAGVNINDRLVVQAIDEPADAVSIRRIRRVDRALHRIRASNGRQVDVIGVVREISNRIEISGARLQISDRLKHKSVACCRSYKRSAAVARIDHCSGAGGRRIGDESSSAAVAGQLGSLALRGRRSQILCCRLQ